MLPRRLGFLFVLLNQVASAPNDETCPLQSVEVRVVQRPATVGCGTFSTQPELQLSDLTHEPASKDVSFQVTSSSPFVVLTGSTTALLTQGVARFTDLGVDCLLWDNSTTLKFEPSTCELATVHAEVHFSGPIPDRGTYPDPRDWTMLELQAVAAELEVAKEVGIDAQDPCSIIKARHELESGSARGAQMHSALTGGPIASFAQPEAPTHKEQVKPIPLLGTGVLPRDILDAAGLIRSIDFDVETIVLAVDGPLPTDAWGVCWGRELDQLQAERGATLVIVRHTEQRGCSAGWNAVLNTNPSAPWALIPNADVDFAPGDLKKIAAMAWERLPTLGIGLFKWQDGTVNWSTFLLSRKTVDTIGTFDENYFPKYSEDDDYRIRSDIAGVRIDIMPDIVMHHGVRRKLAEYKSKRVGLDASPSRWGAVNMYVQFVQNKHYEKFKWNYRGSCRYRNPFNTTRPVSYWRLDPERIACIRRHRTDVTNVRDVEVCEYHFNKEEEAENAGTIHRDWDLSQGWDPGCHELPPGTKIKVKK